MTNPAGELTGEIIRLNFDRRLMLQFSGSVVTSDAGLIPCHELDDALGLIEMAGERLLDARTGNNGRHALSGLFRQSVFGRLAGYEDVNDAERLRARRLRARWVASRRSGSLRERTFRLSPTFQDNGLIVFMHAVRREASCSTWIRA